MTKKIDNANELLFISNLKHLRKEKNLTQGQMAIRLRIKLRCYQKWEQEQAFPKEVAHLLRITEIFEVTLHDMLTIDLSIMKNAA